MKDKITYKEFGAVGDGITDDMPAIARAHEAANKSGLALRAEPGATYYISPKNVTAIVKTSVDWTGAEFIIDDRGCEDHQAPVFHVSSAASPVELPITSLVRGQTRLDNPSGRDLHVIVKNRNHLDYIRYGLNQNNGTARTDNFILYSDGSISSPISFDFDEITDIKAQPIDSERLTLIGGKFTTIANQAESKYNYHSRNIRINRSNVEVADITHLITGELDHGAPYGGFIDIGGCAKVEVHDCTFTGHFIYYTIGSAGKTTPMGSYDISCNTASEISFKRCTQTTDIMDRRYWGLIGSNFCRDLLFEDCNFSRFDAHMGVSNCTLRRCKLGWQCLNAIGHGTFVIEDTDAYGYAFINLREDYGSTWRGDMIVKNCTWHPLGDRRAVIAGHNDGHHFFGYDCYIPQNIDIDGLTIAEETVDERPLYIFNDYGGSIPDEERKFMPIPPKSVRVKNIRTERSVKLCPKPELMPDTLFDVN